MRELNVIQSAEGFSLVELMIAAGLLAFGLLAIGRLLYVTTGLEALARARTAAVLTARDEAESLSGLYRRDPSAQDLALGNHGPQIAEITNPVDGTILNRCQVTWSLDAVSDPRPGKELRAKAVAFQITPIDSAGELLANPPIPPLYLRTVMSRETP